MKYIFTTKAYGQEGIYGVKYESISDKEKALFQINSYAWTAQEVQNLIDKSKSLQGEEELEYQVEGGHLYMIIDKTEVYFYNLLTEQKEEDFKWTFDEFITFMEDFKKFVAEN